MSRRAEREGGGCAAFIAVVLVIGVVVGTVISVAALVDPFSSLPSVSEVWSDCEDDFSTAEDECELATRFPGFWPKVIAGFAWVVAAVGLLGWLASAVAELREARALRFASPAAAERYRLARRTLASVSGLVGAIATLLVVAALA